MMRFDPSIQVRRMVVERGGEAVYDEAFHAGVNVIRGENSSGKSTILNFIFYGLGGDLADWSAVALLCNRVLLEVGTQREDGHLELRNFKGTWSSNGYIRWRNRERKRGVSGRMDALPLFKIDE